MSRHSQYYKDLEEISKDQNVSTRVANDVLVLRQQSHHTPELEKQFIDVARSAPEVPDVRTFGK